MERIRSFFQYIIKPIPQPVSYHNFADKRNFLGIPNCLNVLSNLGFLLASIYGLIHNFYSSMNKKTKIFFMIFYVSLMLTTFGSAYYHWNPNNQTLIWDRIPTSLSLTSIASALLVERSNYLATIPIAIIIILSAPISSLYWYYSEMYFIGDIRPYILTQSVPIIIFYFLLILFPKTNDNTLYKGFLFSILARLGEYFDKKVYELTFHIVSGHTCKHLFFALSGFFVAFYSTEKIKNKIN
jgi:hypothetical protein